MAYSGGKIDKIISTLFKRFSILSVSSIPDFLAKDFVLSDLLLKHVKTLKSYQEKF